MLTKRIFVLAPLLYLSIALGFANSDGLDSEQALIIYVESLREKATDPVQIAIQAEPLIQKSKNANWPRALVYASSYKLEALIFQENTTEANPLYAEILPIAQALNEEIILIRLALIKIKLRYLTGDIANINALYQPLEELVLATDNLRLIGEVFLGIGNIQESTLELSDAIKSYQKAYHAFGQIDNAQLLASATIGLANVYQDIGDVDLAIDYYQQALDFMRSSDNLYGESVIHYNIGKAYLLDAQYNLAEQSMRNALTLSAKIDDFIGVALANLNIAEIMNKQEQWQEAISLFVASEKVFVEVGDFRSQYYAALGQANAYNELGKISRSQEKLAEVEILNTLVDEPLIKRLYHDLKASISAKNGDFEAAYNQLRLSVDLQNKLFNQQQEQESQKYKVEFDTQLKEQQNELLVKENALKSLEILQQQKQKRIWNIVIILVLVIFVIILAFLFAQIRIRNKFKVQAFKDVLTDSPNRRAVLEYAEKQLKIAQVTDSELSIGIIDLDLFKTINDRFGHDTGDKVLVSFAQACKDTLRGQDSFGRYGGEEWLLIFTNTKQEQINHIFTRLRDSLNKQTIAGLPDDYTLTFSMGVAQIDKQRKASLSKLIDLADKNLYIAKNQGRNRVFP